MILRKFSACLLHVSYQAAGGAKLEHQDSIVLYGTRTLADVSKNETLASKSSIRDIYWSTDSNGTVDVVHNDDKLPSVN